MKGFDKIRGFRDKIPKRVVMTILLSLSFAHIQLFRNVHPTAMKILSEEEYLKKENELYARKNRSNNTICPHLERQKSPPPYQDIRGKNNEWKIKDNQAAAKAYNLAYSVVVVPIGIMADRCGGKNFITGGILAGIGCTLSAPFVIDATGGAVWVMELLTMISGGFTAAVITGGYAVMSHWAPPIERARLCGSVFAGTHLGAALHFAVTPRLIRKTHNYAIPFYIYSGTGLLLMVLWHIFGASTPYEKKSITPDEKLYLDIEMGHTVDHRRRKKVVFFRMFTSIDVLATWLAIGMYIWSWNISLIFMDVYMSNVLNRSSIADKELLNLLFVLLVVTGLSGCFFSDWAIHTNTVSRTTIRKVFTNIALMGPAIFLLAGAYSHCNVDVTGALFLISGSLCGYIIPGALMVPFDLAPNYAGTIMGLGTAVGTICLIFADIIIKKTTPDRTLGQYRTLFWIVLATSAACNYFFVLFGNANEKGWNRPDNRVRRQRKSSA